MQEVDANLIVRIDDHPLIDNPQIDTTPPHRDAFVKKNEIPYLRWIDINSPEVFGSFGFIMCVGAFVFKDSEFLFSHLYIPDGKDPSERSEDLKYLRDALELQQGIKRIVLLKLTSNDFQKAGVKDEDNRRIFSEAFFHTIQEFNKVIGEWADSNGIEVNILDVRLKEGEFSFSLTIGDGEVYIWSSTDRVPVKRFSLNDLKDLNIKE